jgi:hypothetical protein
VYGRRRIGKTRLVKQAFEDHVDAVFYQTRQKTRTLQLEQFVERAADVFPVSSGFGRTGSRSSSILPIRTRSSSSTSSQDHEVDVVGLTDEDVLIAGECKYRASPADFSVLSSLEDHVEELRWTPDSGGDRTCKYALFSRNGYTDAVRDAAAERSDLRLYSVSDVVDVLTGINGERS